MRSINGEREVKSIYSLFCATNSLPFVARSAENFFWDIVSSIDSPFWNKTNWSEKTNLKKEITHSYDNDSAKISAFYLSVVLQTSQDFQLRVPVSLLLTIFSQEASMRKAVAIHICSAVT